ncbi:uncharacterized protein LOC109861851 isoform X2 [Pseudomyrmex gracilis]|uniref:uncharacterized protein LOC109861851 isoform X2 n=1 Tax=Pseudomyrmex gracilis TaxID=219809 RepID=UPI000995AEB4|nr:uncharacterized protein LOC109861851 isoform X2 [Pseudomyrmex gracilis]
MTDLNKELNEYLTKNEKQFKVDVPLVPIPKPNLFGRKWFRQHLDEVKEEAGWFQRMQGNCCPNLTLVTRYKYITVCILLGALCFTLKMIYFFKGFRLRKVALLHSVGSLFFLLAYLLSPVGFWFFSKLSEVTVHS